jgi:uncharacterized protein YhbP (UPF0306 family)
MYAGRSPGTIDPQETSMERSTRPLAAGRLTSIAESLLDASSLCAIATVSPGNRAYVNTAYFAWSRKWYLVWMSDPEARHSRNIRAKRSVAIAVYDSRQSWGNPDRGLQLFGTARELEGAAAREAEEVYASRFPAYEPGEFAYRFYQFRPRRLKLFDERALGAGVFVTAVVEGKGRLTWKETEVYRLPAAERPPRRR